MYICELDHQFHSLWKFDQSCEIFLFFLIRLIVIKKKNYIKIREVYSKKYNYSDKTDKKQPTKKIKTKRRLKVKITYYQDR
jgi:hypothetical protein